MNFYNQTINGEIKATIPKWIGISGIQNTLSSTNIAIDLIAQNSKSAFPDTTWADKDTNNFINSLSNAYSKFSGRTLTNYNPSASKKVSSKITPLYIGIYGNYDKNNTILNGIYTEFNNKIKLSVDMINSAKSYSSSISQYSDNIKAVVNDINNQLFPLTNTFSDFENTIISPWIDYVS